MSHTLARVTITQSGRNTLKANAQHAHALPSPDETWRLGDVPFGRRFFRKILSDGLIIKDQPGDYHNGAVWRTRRATWDYIQQKVPEPTQTPCGHTGVRNLGGDEYTCLNDDCEQTFGREAAEQVVFG